MKTVTVADIEAHFSTYLEQSQTEGPIIITQNGKAVAVLMTPPKMRLTWNGSFWGTHHVFKLC